MRDRPHLEIPVVKGPKRDSMSPGVKDNVSLDVKGPKKDSVSPVKESENPVNETASFVSGDDTHFKALAAV